MMIPLHALVDAGNCHPKDCRLALVKAVETDNAQLHYFPAALLSKVSTIK
jgi:hypothetical protein